MSEAMRRYNTIRLPLHEVWEDGKGNYPLFVSSDAMVVREHLAEYPQDTTTVRWWVREGAAEHTERDAR